MEKRTCNINVRVTEDQHKLLEEMADEFSRRNRLDHVSVSCMIRSMILAGHRDQAHSSKTLVARRTA